MVFKKHLTPLSRHGRVQTHRGKGSTTQRSAPGDREDLTGGDSLDRATNRYPKAPLPTVAPTTAPPLGGPPLGPSPPPDMGAAPTANMPPLDMGMGPPLPDDQG